MQFVDVQIFKLYQIYSKQKQKQNLWLFCKPENFNNSIANERIDSHYSEIQILT